MCVLHTEVKYRLYCAISTAAVKVWACLFAPLKNNKQKAEQDHAMLPWFDRKWKFLIAVKKRGFSFMTYSGLF